MLKWFAATAFLALAVLGVAACGGDDEEAANASRDGAESATLTLTARDFSFEPAELGAASGQLLTIKVQNNGAAEHTFTVDGLGIDEEVAAGEQKNIEVSSAVAGEFEFYCRYHHSKMSGTITIGEGGASPTKDNSGGSGYGY